ncbi:MAG: ABC transporter permease [Anaerolineaceae bacterium]|nr:ABC transporter permease [Anaerolineaceae bacterium]
MLKYIIRRLLMMIPMMVLVSMVSFMLIELPPGDFMTQQITNWELSGLQVSQQEIDSMVRRFGLDQPVHIRYMTWVKRLVIDQDLGISFEYQRPVMELIKERLPATMILVTISLLVSWAVAIPAGIYSATHQYSILDYLFTFFGFVGMGSPGFLVAMILAWISIRYFHFSPIGLMSMDYIGKAWDWPKFIDVMKHAWFPILVMSLSGTGGLMRTMRNNLLDELGKQYVMTARAKGLPFGKLLMKYPVRLALNPVIVGTAGILPGLFAGGGLIAIVLGLDTIGPLLLMAVQAQDMYVAGSILTILGALIMLGNFLSDLVLAAVDPRVRLGAGVVR